MRIVEYRVTTLLVLYDPTRSYEAFPHILKSTWNRLQLDWIRKSIILLEYVGARFPEIRMQGFHVAFWHLQRHLDVGIGDLLVAKVAVHDIQALAAKVVPGARRVEPDARIGLAELVQPHSLLVVRQLTPSWWALLVEDGQLLIYGPDLISPRLTQQRLLLHQVQRSILFLFDLIAWRHVLLIYYKRLRLLNIQRRIHIDVLQFA